MQALGNDFVIIDATKQAFEPNEALIRDWSDRHKGIGFDQLLILRPSKKADFFCNIFNMDGSPAEQCGNGMRCLARFLREELNLDKKKFSIETYSSKITYLRIMDEHNVEVDMGPPDFDLQKISNGIALDNQTIKITLPDLPLVLPFSAVSLGNPHAIFKLPLPIGLQFAQVVQAINISELFPMGVNIGFMDIVNRNSINLTTFERGAGLTSSCGSNACAAVVCGIHNNWLDDQVEVKTSGGSLQVLWSEKAGSIKLIGPAIKVFRGCI